MMGSLDDDDENVGSREDSRHSLKDMAVDELSSPVKKRRAKLLSVFDTEYTKCNNNNVASSVQGNNGEEKARNGLSVNKISEQRRKKKKLATKKESKNIRFEVPLAAAYLTAVSNYGEVGTRA